MADLSISRLTPGSARPTTAAKAPPAPGPQEGYAGSVEPRRYTVISLLGTSLSNGIGAPTEPREYVEKLAPQIQDNSLAVVILGTYKEADQNSWRSRRYAIDQQGVRDTTESLSGFHIAHGQATPARGSEVSAMHPETVKRHILEAMREYPAEHYVLHINSHGSNLKGLGGCPNESLAADDHKGVLDHHSRLDKIDLPTLGEIFADVHKETGQKMSVVDIDTCSMGFQEVNSTLQPHADFIIASPAAEKGHKGVGDQPDRCGHQQVEVFEKIVQNPQITPRQLAREFIEVNAREGVIREGGQTYHAAPTLSAYSSQGIADLNQKLDQLGARLLQELTAKPERSLLSFFKKPLSGSQKIQNAVDQTRIFPSGKGDPYLDLQHFAENLAAQYPEDTEMQKLTAGVRQGVSEAALASHHGVGDEDGKMVDYSPFGPLGVFLPGAKDNPFSEGIRTLYRSSASGARFWNSAWEKVDQLKLNPEERDQLEAIQSQQQFPPVLSPLGRRIWAHEVSQRLPGLEEYHRTPNLPPQWKEFVLSWISETVSRGLS
ncbi:hypothetical protein ABS71_01615 [bacterium SCN 62-11]|mgnify:CR=1 FL=1|nr:MAG: hypothetical protein ABS71_01615 [bacterium SCN 62-11]